MGDTLDHPGGRLAIGADGNVVYANDSANSIHDGGETHKSRLPALALSVGLMAVVAGCAANVPAAEVAAVQVAAGNEGSPNTKQVVATDAELVPADAPIVVAPIEEVVEPTAEVSDTQPTESAETTEVEKSAVEVETDEPIEKLEVVAKPTPNETATLEAVAGGPPIGGVGGAPEGGTQPEPGVGVDAQADPVITVVDEGYFEIEGIKVFGSWQDAGVLEVRPQGDGSVIVNDGEVDPSTLEKAYKFPGTDKVTYSNNVVEFKFKITGDGGEKLTIYNVLAHGTLMAIVRNGDATYLVLDCGGTKWGFPTSEYTKFYKHDALKEDLTSDTELLGFGEEGMVNLSDPNGGSEVIVSLQYNGPNNNGKGLVDEGMTEVYELEEPAGGKP